MLFQIALGSVLILTTIVAGSLSLYLVEIVLWRVHGWLLREPDWDTAVYFALETFTTLGFGDVLAPPLWRILAGMAAANGLLNFGLMTAVLMEGVRDLRIRQSRSRSSRPGHRAGHEEV